MGGMGSATAPEESMTHLSGLLVTSPSGAVRGRCRAKEMAVLRHPTGEEEQMIWRPLGVVLLIVGCASADDVLRVPHEVGISTYVRATPAEVALAVPTALDRARFEDAQIVTAGPPEWVALGKTGATLGSDGLWGRVVIRPLATDVTEVIAYCHRRGGGQFDNPFASARNILLNILLLTSPEARRSDLDALRAQSFQPQP